MNGVDEDFLGRDGLPGREALKSELGLEPETPLFVFAHHLIPSHHPLALVRAVDALARTGLDVAVAVAGDGPERAPLEEAVRRAGLERRVLVLGNVRRMRIRELLAAADAVLSLDELSNLVNSVLEALALGTPVVATATGGTGRLLVDGKNALLLARPDGDAVASALRRLVDDAELTRRLREGAAATARERIESWDDRIAREAEMLKEVATA
jgi:glycosyltransferase involved in cell wall biosynthesis